MSSNSRPAYNPWFLYPFILWAAVGAALHFKVGKVPLFMTINSNHNDLMDSLMYYTTMMGEAPVIIFALLLPLLVKRYRTWWYFVLAATCNMMPFIAQQVLKSYFHMYRPLHYFADKPWFHKLPEWPWLYERSFPSGHSTGAFSFFCFLALVLRPHHRAWGLVFFLLAMSVCYSRIYLAAHFFEDVYAGSVIGTVLTSATFVLMERYVKPYLGQATS